MADQELLDFLCRFGPIDVLVANAGSAAPGLFLDMPTATFQEQMNLNYMGTVRSIKVELFQPCEPYVLTTVTPRMILFDCSIRLWSLQWCSSGVAT